MLHQVRVQLLHLLLGDLDLSRQVAISS